MLERFYKNPHKNIKLKKVLNNTIPKNFLKKVIRYFASKVVVKPKSDERLTEILALGKILSNLQLNQNTPNLNDYEFKIFSQCGDDGIIQYLIKNIKIKNNFFIEFGVGDFMESTCRFLMMNNNWSGFIIDSDQENIKKVKNKSWYWLYDLKVRCEFIHEDNINSIIRESNQNDIGILHIDIDGNDYHIFKKINLIHINPAIIILEYNSVFGCERAITIPYRKDFNRTKAHYSNLYFGASLKALNSIADKKGYSLIGTNSNGVNAYFVRNDLLNEKIKKVNLTSAYNLSKHRESRDINGNYSFLSGQSRLESIKGLQVLNTISKKIEIL